jgi:hypothetical protein
MLSKPFFFVTDAAESEALSVSGNYFRLAVYSWARLEAHH